MLSLRWAVHFFRWTEEGYHVWVCGWNPKVWSFKWKLVSSTFLRYCLLSCTRWFQLWVWEWNPTVWWVECRRRPGTKGFDISTQQRSTLVTVEFNMLHTFGLHVEFMMLDDGEWCWSNDVGWRWMILVEWWWMMVNDVGWRWTESDCHNILNQSTYSVERWCKGVSMKRNCGAASVGKHKTLDSSTKLRK